MLYDKKWDKEVKTDPWSLASLIAWLEIQPPAGTYNFYNCQGTCLIGQFMAFNGVAWSDPAYGKVSNREVAPDTMMWEIAINAPHTFGAALKRARKLSRS